MMSSETRDRTYLDTHPWITFDGKYLDSAPPLLWLLLGEARSKCEHLAGVPLPPAIALFLHRLYLAKGMQGTTAIEGNTLTVEQVQKHLAGELELPPSQQYLQKEIDNILAACGAIEDETFHQKNPRITPGLISFFNETVLAGLELEEGVTPGKLRTHEVGVLRYRAAPAGDCAYLLERLCEWLNSNSFVTNDDMGLAVPIMKAIIAHLYLAWIHPFGDGNGRTARLLEFYILIDAGVPTPAAHLLSNHYNLTRSSYYRELDKASKSGGDIRPFVLYALRGFVDQLKEQITTVQFHQVQIAWRDYVNEYFEHRTSPAEQRRKRLVHQLSWLIQPLRRREMLEDPSISQHYQGKTMKTLTRDLNALVEAQLVSHTAKGFRARTHMILAFLPKRIDKASEIKRFVLARRRRPAPSDGLQGMKTPGDPSGDQPPE
jgi:Fic family protein